MESGKTLFNYFKGYEHVADFQRLCGVEIVELEAEQVSKSSVNGNDHCQQNDHSLHQRNVNSVHKNGYKNGMTNSSTQDKVQGYKINNKAFHLLMEFGAGLGSEMFYLIFFPFMVWNVDSRLTRQICLIWYPLMYVGQFMKDCIKWPRPGRPAVRLEGNRFEMEYGMPSTHTIVGTCMPFSLLVLTSKYYEYPFVPALLVALFWTVLVACSRVYLGMHTVLDCIAGISMTALALPWMLSVVEYVDYYQVTSPYAPFVSILIPLLACIYYPKPEVWSITRGDTSNIVSIGTCVIFSAWLNYHLGWMTETPRPTTLQPIPPITYDWLYYSFIRMFFGVIALSASRIITKIIFLKFVCTCAGVDTKDIPKQRELGLEVPVRWLTIGGLAVSTAFTAPLCFNYFGINREGYYSEVGL